MKIEALLDNFVEKKGQCCAGLLTDFIRVPIFDVTSDLKQLEHFFRPMLIVIFYKRFQFPKMVSIAEDMFGIWHSMHIGPEVVMNNRAF